MTADGGVGCWRCEEGLLSLKVRRYLLTGDGQPRSMLTHLFSKKETSPIALRRCSTVALLSSATTEDRP